MITCNSSHESGSHLKIVETTGYPVYCSFLKCTVQAPLAFNHQCYINIFAHGLWHYLKCLLKRCKTLSTFHMAVYICNCLLVLHWHFFYFIILFTSHTTSFAHGIIYNICLQETLPSQRHYSLYTNMGLCTWHYLCTSHLHKKVYKSGNLFLLFYVTLFNSCKGIVHLSLSR